MIKSTYIPICNPNISNDDVRQVAESVRSGWLNESKKVREFENRFKDYIGSKYAVAMFNGTVALHSMLLACGIGKGDEVIVPSLTFISTVTSLLYVGAKPVFADIEPATFTIDPQDIKRKITKRTKAIIAVHYGGQPADLGAILNISRKNNLALFEDAAEAHGAEYKSVKVGNFGKASMFSFTPTKVISTGEGGMITTGEKRIADRLRLLKNHGQTKQYVHTILGYNYRMTEMQGALGISQLGRLEKFISMRRKNAKYLTDNLKDVEGIITPFEAANRRHIYMMYTIKVDDKNSSINRDTLMRQLYARGIESKIYFPPVHLQRIFKKMGSSSSRLPVTEQSAKQILSLPVYPNLTKNNLDYIINSIKEISRGK